GIRGDRRARAAPDGGQEPGRPAPRGAVRARPRERVRARGSCRGRAAPRRRRGGASPRLTGHPWKPGVSRAAGWLMRGMWWGRVLWPPSPLAGEGPGVRGEVKAPGGARTPSPLSLGGERGTSPAAHRLPPRSLPSFSTEHLLPFAL